MEVTLKIERYDPETDERRLESHTVDVLETATLLDVLDVIKDEVDGSLTFRKSFPSSVRNNAKWFSISLLESLRMPAINSPTPGSAAPDRGASATPRSAICMLGAFMN